jgi:ATP-binding cassette subfamily B protein RaxB
MLFEAVNGFLVMLENAAILYLGARAVLANDLSVGMFIAFLSYKDQFVKRSSALIDQALSLRLLGLQTDRLADIVLSKPEPRLTAPALHSKAGVAPTLELRNVSFQYAPGERWVLKDLSLKIDAGEAVAIAGPSGSGKTTLLKVMLGQLIPQEGEVLVGGMPLQQMGLQAYRDMIGVVMQDDRLFAGTVGENMALFDPDIDHEKIEKVADMAALHEDIAQMPMGYNTLVGDMGSALSGGQKQRVVLARALYREPKILFLDEATSSLDTATEAAVNSAIQQLKVTRVVIAHRPQTIASMDRVIYVEPVSEVDG